MDLSNIIGHEVIKEMLPKWVENPGFAYLFTGPAHVGKALIAEKLVRDLAEHPDDKPLEIHPDIIVLLPEEGKKEISVKVVREARTRLYERPQIAKRMVVYLPKMEWLNQEGFNTLLKVMEEPPAGAVFVGVAPRQSGIPATILSRMAIVALKIAKKEQIVEALQAKGVGADEANLLATIARGRPGLVLGAASSSESDRKLAKKFVLAQSLAGRLAAIGDMRKSAESAEDQREAWSNLLSVCMDEVRAIFSANRTLALILGQGLVDAEGAIEGAIAPYIMLEGAAILASREKLVLPNGMPRAYPLSLSVR